MSTGTTSDAPPELAAATQLARAPATFPRIGTPSNRAPVPRCARALPSVVSSPAPQKSDGILGTHTRRRPPHRSGPSKGAGEPRQPSRQQPTGSFIGRFRGPTRPFSSSSRTHPGRQELSEGRSRSVHVAAYRRRRAYRPLPARGRATGLLRAPRATDEASAPVHLPLNLLAANLQQEVCSYQPKAASANVYRLLGFQLLQGFA